eukprot:TRINITY_DN62485_c0_g1_i1.p1 TRINITY_DN62485_c0_g1~~TRINITY_DN62485_c0_g1_i1.p1  ORF type:complete len:589 (-),score=131.59 TRINITY_DN62485_c0_g1_i1:101-1867(-)
MAAEDGGKGGDVGLCGWIAFVVINLFLCALTTGGAWFGWQLGFCILLFYALGILTIALNLENQGHSRAVSNLLWVIFCVQVLCLGTWLGICAIGEWKGLFAWRDETIAALDSTIDGTSEAIKAWASDSHLNPGVGHAVWGGLLFNAMDESSRRLLMRASAPGEMVIVAPGLLEAHSFIEWKGDLYFFARPNAETGEGFWTIRSGSRKAELLEAFNSGYELRQFYPTTGMLYFKAQVACGGFQADTIYMSDGNANGTTNFHEGRLYDNLVKSCRSLVDGVEFTPPADRVLGVLFLGVLPQTCLGFVKLWWGQVPGTIVNIYGGIYATGLMIWLLIATSLDRLMLFFKVTLTAYAVTGYIAAAVVRLVWRQVPGEILAWGSGVIALTYWGAVHIALNIPFNEDPWSWLCYGLVQLPPMLLALILQVQLPVALSGVAFLILAYKVAFTAVELVGLGLNDDIQLIAQYAILCCLGTLILVIGVFYTRHQRKFEALLLGFFGIEVDLGTVEAPTGSEAAGDEREGEESKSQEKEEEEEEGEEEEDETASLNMIAQLPFQELLRLHRMMAAQKKVEPAEGEAPTPAAKGGEEDC